MSTPPEEVRSRPTVADTPDAWAGPSFMYSGAGERGWQVVAGGWRGRALEWEQRAAEAGLTDRGITQTPWGWTGQRLEAADSPAGAAGVAGEVGASELEIVLDAWSRDGHYLGDGVRRAVGAVLGERALDELGTLPVPGATSITRNRPLLPVSEAGLRVVDLRFSTLPYSHGDTSRPIQLASRWLRLAATGTGMVALWTPLEGRWRPEHIRWPHHAVPSRRVQSLRVAGRAAGVEERLACLLSDALEHERYYLETWQMELEAWEATIYGSLAAGEAVLRGLDLSDPVREQAGALAVFLSRAQFDLRAVQRRGEVEPLLAGAGVQEVLRCELAQAADLLATNQRLRRHAFSLLTSVATGEQLQAARDQAEAAQAQQEATEGLQQTITWITALLLAPTVVIGVFGANLRELAAGRGTLVQLAQWMLLAAGLSVGALWWRNPPRRRRRLALVVAGLVGFAAAIGGAVLWHDGRAGDARLWVASTGTWTIALAVASLRRPRVRRRRRGSWRRRRGPAQLESEQEASPAWT